MCYVFFCLIILSYTHSSCLFLIRPFHLFQLTIFPRIFSLTAYIVLRRRQTYAKLLSFIRSSRVYSHISVKLNTFRSTNRFGTSVSVCVYKTTIKDRLIIFQHITRYLVVYEHVNSLFFVPFLHVTIIKIIFSLS